MARTKQIKIADLYVNTDNYRFESVSGQKEAIDKMVSDQGEKLFNLAEHIVTYGLNPNDRIQVAVSHHDKTKFNVLEGNRRIVSLKLLNNPDLLDGGHSSLKRKFVKLHEEKKSKLPKIIDCTVYDDAKEADVWIGIKHGYGKSGTMTNEWDPYQKGRFEEKMEGKSSIVLQTIRLLKTAPDVPIDVKLNLGELKVTNLDRLIADPDVRDFLGMEINNGLIQSSIEQKEVVKGLTQIVKDLLKPNFKVSQIYNKDDRKDYLKNFPKASIPNKKAKAKKPWQVNGSVTPTPLSSPKPKPNPKDRNTLIPKSCSLKISKPKVNSLYHELLKLDLTKFTNATAVSLRVFVELSVDCYLEEHSLIPTPSAAKSGMDFLQKINVTANHMENKKFADPAICKGIKLAIKDKNDILGIDTWHAYVHNNKFSPKESHLIITWDNIQSFIERVWANIK